MKPSHIAWALVLLLTGCDKKPIIDPIVDPETPPIHFDFDLARFRTRPAGAYNGGGEVRQSFIDNYVQGDIELVPSWDRPYFFVIRPAGGHVIRTSYSNSMEENIKSGFYAAAYDHSDLGFNRQTSASMDVWRDSFAQIHVYSDADWDREHPAGTPLDDLLQIQYSTVAPFIRGGYVSISARKKNDAIDPGYYRTPICGQLSRMGRMEMVLADDDIYIVFASAPTKAKKHTLTVELTTDRGEVKKASLLQYKPRVE